MDQRFNALKGISIFFVICIHMTYSFFSTNNRPPLFGFYNLITCLAVPMFMITGGYFFAKKYHYKRLIWKQYLLKLLNRIIFPYYFVAILLSLYNLAIGKNIFWKQYLFFDSNEHGLYFLIAYTYGSLFCAFFYFFFSNLNAVKLSLILNFFGAFFIFVDGPGNVLSQLYLISLFCFGTSLYHFDRFITKKNKMIRILVMLAPLSVILIVVLISGRYYTYIPVTSVAFFIFTTNLLRNNSIIKFTNLIKINEFGVESLSIFLIHPFILKLVNPIIKEGFNHFGMSYFNNTFILYILTISFVIAILSIYIAKVLKRIKFELAANLFYVKTLR